MPTCRTFDKLTLVTELKGIAMKYELSKYQTITIGAALLNDLDKMRTAKNALLGRMQEADDVETFAALREDADYFAQREGEILGVMMVLNIQEDGD